MVQGTMNGYGERCGNANLISIIPNLQLKMGKTVPAEPRGPDRSDVTSSRRCSTCSPTPNQAYVGKNAFAHKGGMHVAGVNADPSTFEHIDPAEVGNSREVLVSELSGKGTVIAHAGGALDDADRLARGRAREGARAPRLPVRGRRRLLRAADQARDGRVRAAVQARVLARDRREARRRARRDRGHGQGLGRQPALRPHRGGQRPRARARPRAARRRSASTSRTCATSSSSTSRSVSSTSGKRRARRRGCCWTPGRDRDLGRDRGARERDRGVVGRAGRFARSGDAAQRRRRSRVDPARTARHRASSRRTPCSRSCAPSTSRSARACPLRAEFAARVGAPHASRGVHRHRGAAPRAARGRRQRRATRSITSPFSSSPPPTRSSTSARSRCSSTSTRARSTSTSTPRRPRSPEDYRAAAGPHLRLPGRHARAGAARPADRRGRLRGARRHARRRHRRSAAAATPPPSASTPTSSSSTGEGGMLTTRQRRRSRRAWTPSATRAARPTWAGSTTTGSASTTA